MKNLFDKGVYAETMHRLDNLSPASQNLWGKMKVAQMLAHCKEAFKVPLSQTPLPRMFIGRLIGWAIKSKLYNESPWKQNLPTAPNFLIKDERNFNEEKTQLKELIDQFYSNGTEGVTKHPHPFFGKFTPEQWGQSMYKHLDHHFRQFGV